ncbi:hypothetical protein [Natrinema sp. SYSU A 869]|uniref:hypothetical protein n=1 Tax=Natrinema sp. SYSU A 869 TaxID=2871694 RepID=UPI00210849E5|nr:hypothetical protein [Natrinema sp. SYSU A 869]
MKTDISDAKSADTDQILPSNTIFELLLAEQRRYALYYLSRKVGQSASRTSLIGSQITRQPTPNGSNRSPSSSTTITCGS